MPSAVPSCYLSGLILLGKIRSQYTSTAEFPKFNLPLCLGYTAQKSTGRRVTRTVHVAIVLLCLLSYICRIGFVSSPEVGLEPHPPLRPLYLLSYSGICCVKSFAFCFTQILLWLFHFTQNLSRKVAPHCLPKPPAWNVGIRQQQGVYHSFSVRSRKIETHI